MRCGRWAAERRRATCSSTRCDIAIATACLSEDIHPQTGALWGNFPQTYSMAGLILTRDAAVAKLGGSILARLVIVSNRVGVPDARHARRRPRSGDHARRSSVTVASGSAGADALRDDVPRPSRSRRRTTSPTSRDLTQGGYRRISTTASPTGCCGRSCITGSTWRNSRAATCRGYLRVNEHFADELAQGAASPTTSSGCTTII